MIKKDDLIRCKEEIGTLVGRKVRVKSNGGRRRTVVREGVIEDVYPRVFTVRAIRENQNDSELVSYSYVDILTEAIEVAVEPAGVSDDLESLAKTIAEAEEAAKTEAEAAE